MTFSRERVAALFARALALPTERRRAFLDVACSGDPATRAEVDSLLAAHEAADGWFESLEARLVRPARAAIARDSRDDVVGTNISHYAVLERAGAGGMGVVYRARDCRLDRFVALKLLARTAGGDPAALERHIREARAASSLDHPNIGVVHDVGETADGRLYIVMAWVEGETLEQRLRRGPLSVAEALSVARQLACALQAAHDAGIVHRDVKPGNVMLGSNGAVRLLDFGVARLPGSDLTQAGATPGTVGYMSPEQTRGEAVDPRSDIWSLGVLLFEMLCGARPFRGDSEEVVIYAIRNDDPPDIMTLRPDVPAAVAAVVARCLRRCPGERWARAADVQARLERVSQGGTALPVPAAPAGQAAAHGAAGARRFHPRRLRARFARFKRTQAGVAIAIALALGASAYTVATSAGGRGGAVDPPGTGVRIDPARVAVAAFENRTGDPALDVVGSMAADWITQGLSQTGLADVVPVTASLAASRHVAGLRRPRTELPRLMAEETRAGLIVSGAYYRQADSLYLRATVADGIAGTILDDLPPVAAAVDAPLAGVESLRRRVMSVLATRLDRRMQDYAALVREPPSFEAYRAYAEGMQLFLARDWTGAVGRFTDASALDSTFGLPLFYTGIAYNNMGDYAAVDSVIRLLRPHADRYGEVVRLGVDVLDAFVRGDYAATYRIHLRAAHLVPNTLGHSTLIHEALRVNRPRKAVEVAREIDPERGEMRGWIIYWIHLAEAYHQLGEFEEELATARRTQALFPAERDGMLMEIRALTGLGRIDELAALLRREADTDPFPAALLRRAAHELRAHGYRQLADSLLRQSLLPDLLPSGSAARSPLALAGTRLALGDLAEAAALLDTLALRLPDDLAVNGLRGVLAAMRGDAAAAERFSDRIAVLDLPYARGRHTMWRARIAAALGQNARAVELLHRAWREGVWIWPQLHTAHEFDHMRADPAFQELVRPRG